MIYLEHRVGVRLYNSDRAAPLLMYVKTAASKEHLINRQIIFRFGDSAFLGL